MKTLTEIKEYCQIQCEHYKMCQGKSIKLAKVNRTFGGMIITRKGQYYCDYKGK